MSTIVVLVLAMSMLILGLVLVRTIFTGAKYNVDTMNTKVQNEINKLFVEDEKMVIYLANKKLDIKQGQDWGVAFAVKNLVKGVSGSSKFTYTVTADDVSSCAGLSESEAMSWVQVGKSGTLILNPGESGSEIVRFQIPDGAPICFVRYLIQVDDLSGSTYVARSFDLNIQG